MNQRAWLRIAAGLAISALFVWLAYRGIDIADMAQRIARARPAEFALSVLAVMITSLLRSLRWQLCFEPCDGVTFGQAFGAYGLGSLSTQIIPSRLGDFVRVYVLGQSSNVSKSKGLGTLVVERLSDLLTIVILLGSLVPLFALPGWIKAGDGFAAAATAVVLGTVYALARKGAAVPEPGWVAARRVLRVLFQLLIQLINGFSAVKSPRRGLLILLTSFGIWFFQVAQYLACARALGLSVGWREAALITGVQALATIIPAGPGYAGSADLAAISTLALFGISREVSLSYVNLVRAAVLIALLAWGLAALAALRLTARRQSPPLRQPTLIACEPLTEGRA